MQSTSLEGSWTVGLELGELPSLSSGRELVSTALFQSVTQIGVEAITLFRNAYVRYERQGGGHFIARACVMGISSGGYALVLASIALYELLLRTMWLGVAFYLSPDRLRPGRTNPGGVIYRYAENGMRVTMASSICALKGISQALFEPERPFELSPVFDNCSAKQDVNSVAPFTTQEDLAQEVRALAMGFTTLISQERG